MKKKIRMCSMLYPRVGIKPKISELCTLKVCVDQAIIIYIYIYIYIRSAFNRFPGFFVQAFKIVVDS